MPIVAGQLEAGDILFKHASQGAISQMIAQGQGAHYDNTVKQTGGSVMSKAQSCDITHVAMAVGKNDVFEFDEGGASKAEIVFEKGYGFVRGPMSLPSRKGKRYEVFRCIAPKLKSVAVDKAELIWDMTHQGNMVASYGLSKMLGTGMLKNKGASQDLKSFEGQLDQWLRASSDYSGWRKLFNRKPNVQFFCSEFVSYCYMWAASEISATPFGPEYMLGVNRTRLSPVELYVRIETYGMGYFQFKGTLYA